MKQTEMFCHFEGYKKREENDGPYHAHFGRSERTTKAYGDGRIIKVLVRELLPEEKSSYWAWWDNEDSKFEFVYPKRFLTEMCFPDINVSIERGQGLLVNVKVEEQ